MRCVAEKAHCKGFPPHHCGHLVSVGEWSTNHHNTPSHYTLSNPTPPHINTKDGRCLFVQTWVAGKKTKRGENWLRHRRKLALRPSCAQGSVTVKSSLSVLVSASFTHPERGHPCFLLSASPPHIHTMALTLCLSTPPTSHLTSRQTQHSFYIKQVSTTWGEQCA